MARSDRGDGRNADVAWQAPASPRQDSTQVTRICLAPASVEASSGSATAASDAARETFTSYLTGPSLRPEPLKARLASQAKEEAKQSGCPYLLLTTIKHVQKRSGGGLLGRMAAGAAQQGAWEAGAAERVDCRTDRRAGGRTAPRARRLTTMPSPFTTRTS